MFELIGMGVVALIVWMIGKSIVSGLIKGSLLCARDYAENAGVPRDFADEIIGCPDILKQVRRTLASGDRDFAAMDVFEQYGKAIVHLHSKAGQTYLTSRVQQLTGAKQAHADERAGSLRETAAKEHVAPLDAQLNLPTSTGRVLGGDFESGVADLERGDYHTAFAAFKKLAEQGHADAQVNLGNMYGLGLGVSQDEQQAEAWYRKAANQGEAIAQYKLGSMYRNGCGVSKDEQQAIEWFRKAAAQGEVMAQFNLGQMYTEGKGVRKDDHEAMAFYHRAAEQGNARAQFNLGVKFYNGLVGVPKDLQMAYFWWLLASAQGEKSAEKSRDIVEPYLSQEQRAAAQVAARNWQPK